MCMGVSPPCWDRCALCDGTSSLPRARRQGYWRKRSEGWGPVCTFLHFDECRPSAASRCRPPRRCSAPRGGNRTTPEAPARRRDGHPQDLDSLFAASAGPQWTIGLCAGSALIAALSLQPTFARFPATARKQGRPFDRLGKRKSPSPESHPVPSGTGSSNPVPSSEESANHRSPPACLKKTASSATHAGGAIAGARTSRRNARDHRPLIE
jgi:hypothetical protein